MKIAHRLWLSAAFPLLALLFISFQYYRQTLATGLGVAERQLHALPLLQDLMSLLEQVQTQRSHIPQSIIGTAIEPSVLIEESNKIQATLQMISARLGEHAGPLVSASWRKTQERLAPILEKAASGRMESFDTYLLASEAIVQQIDAIGTESNFSSGVERSAALNLLLSDLIPRLTDDLGLTRGLTVFHMTIDEKTTSDVSKISRYLSLSRFRFGRVMEKLARVEDMSPELSKDIVPLRDSLSRDFEAFSHSVESYLKDESSRQPAEIYDQASAAWQGTYSIFDRIFQEIEISLLQKIAGHRADLRNALIAGSLGVLLSALILFLVIASFLRSINRIVAETEKIASGDRKLAITSPPGNDEMSGLSRAVARMYEAICVTEEAIRRESERKMVISEIASKLQGEANSKGISATYLNCLADRLGTVFGAVYLYDPSNAELRSLAVYAPGQEFESRSVVKADKGLLGEALKARKTVLIEELTERNAAAAASGLLRILPEVLLLSPIIFEGEALAVIELGLLKRMDGEAKQLFDETLSAFAIRLKSTIARATLEGLYSQTREQSLELEERQRELEASNQDLEQKTQELEQQQVELETINQKLDQQRTALEHKNATVEAAHIDLERAQNELKRKADDLETASRYKSEFLANMSHELRSPLNSILIFSEMLAKNNHGSLRAKEVEFARSINSSGTDLLRLIEDILDLSKVEAGRLDINPERFDLDLLIAALDESFRPQAEGKGLGFSVVVEADVPRSWMTDQHRLNQILRNFLSNAIKFTDKGEVGLRIARAVSLAPGSSLDPALAIDLAVSDSGIGIRKEDQNKLFVAFQQIDAKSNRRFPGTGLGLSITKNLATCLGGYVGMDSVPGQGSVFRAVLPYELEKPGAPSATHLAKDEQAAPPQVLPLPPIPDDRASVAVNDKILLIIEDDGDFARYLVDNGRARGFKCIVARTGEDGLRDALIFRPTGIILDIKLPGMNGLSVLDRLTSDPMTKRIPVHVISAFEYQIEAQKYENVGYLRKPITHAQLQAIIDRFGGTSGELKRSILVVGREGKERDEVVQSIGKDVVRVTLADSGAAAIALLRDEAFDCIIMDVDLPEESAVDVLQKIKSLGGRETVPVIVLSDVELKPGMDTDVARFASSIIVRGDKGKERLLDEVSLFLHKVESALPSDVTRDLSATSEAFKGRQVLLVDDDMRNLFAIMTVLEGQGMIVQTATNGREAIDKLEGQPNFDIVLMDMMMPEVDGYQAMREIRKDRRFQKLPIIALTARAMKGEREDCLAAGASDYLSKPLKVDQLLALIKIWVA